MTQPFSFARAPAIRFGGGTAAGLAEAVRELGPKALLVTGARSLDASGRLRSIVGGLEAEGISGEAAS
ncbi:MAG: alcohol dehydrogenase, partial [Planctomycetota bacterium]